MTNIHKFVLPNGVRVLVEPNAVVRSAAIGLTCRAGSRHELDNEAGITHFIEHMLFKGTEKRGAKQIAEEIEGRGGMLNAFTDKEQTTYYARVLSDDTANAMDVLTDMLLNSALNPEELEREKGVVLEEIRRGEDEPGDQVHELHIQNRWGEHPLGKPIIGTKESVSGFSPDDLKTYMDRRYLGENLILSIAGNVDPVEMEALAREKMGGFAAGGESATLEKPVSNVVRKEIGKDVEQVHFCMGGESVGIYDPQLYGVVVLDSILGGGMSSRLFQEVRERRGLAYAVGSYNLSYTAAGLFTIYGGTSEKTWAEVQEVVINEIKSVIHDGLRDGELAKVKRQIAGNIVLGMEGMSSRMQRMTKNELFHGREIPIDETLAKIDAVTEQQVRDLCAQILNPEKLGVTAIGPFNA